MTREQRRQKLWNRLTELQRQRQRQEERRTSTAATLREMTLVRAEIIKLENREDREKQRAA